MTVLSNVWVNGDGLAVRYGTEEAAVGRVGSYEDTIAGLQVAEFHFDYTDLSATDGSGILDYTSPLLKGTRIQQVKVICETAATGAGAVMNVGLIKENFSTELDFNGLVAALPLASADAAGEQIILNVGSTYAGALIGTTLSEDGWVTVDYDTAAFTAGKWLVEVYYYTPITT